MRRVVALPEPIARRWLRKAGIGGAALVGGGVILGASAGTARAGHDNPVAITDVDIINFAA